MRRVLAGGAISLILLLSIDAVACQGDRDCPAASRCVRTTFGQSEGVCERGVAPIEGEGRPRVGESGAPKGTEGKPCEFTEDCAPGLVCAAQSNSSLRLCSR